MPLLLNLEVSFWKLRYPTTNQRQNVDWGNFGHLSCPVRISRPDLPELPDPISLSFPIDNHV